MRKATLVSTLYDALLDRLLSNQLKPGEKINLDRLRAELGVSISPLREAVSRLTGTRLIQFEDQRGYTVSEVSLVDFHEVMEICRNSECFALTCAIEQGDLQWESDITAALYRLRNTEANLRSPEWEIAHRDFHRTLVSACKMPRIHAIIEQIAIAQRRYRGLIDAHALSDRSADHIQLAEAALARDAERGCEIMRQHISSVEQEMTLLLHGYFERESAGDIAAQ
ncbi:GntR family transcriptional regulator (plasmid) [Thioclava sp. 'Guangxiensis']|uniref:GntR family transcriptional regulator n=1 Tax=Thioclava sp. 'Guangxiensis' TaxID=3149044 RepID=UPI0032C3F9C2